MRSELMKQSSLMKCFPAIRILPQSVRPNDDGQLLKNNQAECNA